MSCAASEMAGLRRMVEGMRHEMQSLEDELLQLRDERAQLDMERAAAADEADAAAAALAAAEKRQADLVAAVDEVSTSNATRSMDPQDGEYVIIHRPQQDHSGHCNGVPSFNLYPADHMPPCMYSA